MDHDKTPEVLKAELAVRLSIVIGNISLADVLSEEKIKKLEAVARDLAVSKWTIVTSIVRLWNHQCESARVAIYDLIALLCNYDGGICKLPTSRIAQLFNRTDDCIREIIDSLEKDGLLNVRRVDGRPNSYTRTIFGRMADHERRDERVRSNNCSM
jgi:hypothetical protein